MLEIERLMIPVAIMAASQRSMFRPLLARKQSARLAESARPVVPLDRSRMQRCRAVTAMTAHRKTAAELRPDLSPAEQRRLQAALDQTDRDGYRHARELKTLALRMRTEREAADLRQADLAYKLHVHPKTIGRWEHPDGKYGRLPSLADRRRLADIFHTERDYFTPELLPDEDLEPLTPDEEAAL